MRHGPRPNEVAEAGGAVMAAVEVAVVDVVARAADEAAIAGIAETAAIAGRKAVINTGLI